MRSFAIIEYPRPLPWVVARPLEPWPPEYGGTPDVLDVGDQVPASAFGWRDEDGEWLRWDRGKTHIRVPLETLWKACRP